VNMNMNMIIPGKRKKRSACSFPMSSLATASAFETFALRLLTATSAMAVADFVPAVSLDSALELVRCVA